jgi:hypothetical protein
MTALSGHARRSAQSRRRKLSPGRGQYSLLPVQNNGRLHVRKLSACVRCRFDESLAPRPFDEEAFGSWFGRVASRYRMSVDWTCEVNQLGPLPPLTNAGWMLFAPLNDITLRTLANLARLEVARLAQIQTLADWMMPGKRLPYCCRCLVMNPVDVTAPRWKRAWLDPTARLCDEHGETM